MSANDQRPESSRRRIVVPLNPSSAKAGRAPAAPRVASPAPAPRGSRAGKILGILGLILLAVLLALGVGGFFWWRHYQTTPAYSLALLVDAAQRNDMPEVDQIVDTDKIVDHLAGQVVQKAAGRYGGGPSVEISKTIKARLPALLPMIKQQVRDAVAARVKELSTRADQKPFVVIAVALPYLVEVTTAGDKATAVVNIQDQQVKLELERSGDLWKVVGVQDDALAQRMVDEVIKELPAIAPGIESEIKKRLNKPPAALAIP